MKIAIFGHRHQRDRLEQTQTLFSLLQKSGVELFVCKRYSIYLTQECGLTLPPHCLIEEEDALTADIALSIGGDGTFLKTAKRIGDSLIPILGINQGRLGFLTDVSGCEIEAMVKDLMEGEYSIEERTLLQFHTDNMPSDLWHYALNEVAILKRDSSSMIAIHTYLDNDFLNTYQADGLIVATPTGSTAYSLSVGGPVLNPQVPSWAITPVAPHSLNVRPLVVDDSTCITLEVESRSHNFLVSLDGRSMVLDTQQQVRIGKAPFVIRVVKRKNHCFYHTLRKKLMWGADVRESSHPRKPLNSSQND